MDGHVASISPPEVYAQLGTASGPVLIDVRRSEAFDADDALIVGAVRRTPQSASDWSRDLLAGRQVVVYCACGEDVSPGVAARLASAGVPARYLAEGIAGWRSTHNWPAKTPASLPS